MCEFKSRVSSCGHYKTTLWNPCDDAKRNKTPCNVSNSSDGSSTTGGMCYLPGCDKKPGGKREGPGKSIIHCSYFRLYLNITQQNAQMVVLIQVTLTGLSFDKECTQDFKSSESAS